MAMLSKTKIAGDVIKHFESNEFCFDEATLTNAGAVDYTDIDIGGRPVVYDGTTAEFVEVGLVGSDEADVNAIIAEKGHLDGLAAGVTTTRKYVILARGPAVVWQSGMALLDADGNTMTLADLIVPLGAENILQRPGKSALGSEQVT